MLQFVEAIVLCLLDSITRFAFYLAQFSAPQQTASLFLPIQVPVCRHIGGFYRLISRPFRFTMQSPAPRSDGCRFTWFFGSANIGKALQFLSTQSL
jgi:hypothetical protein